MYKTIRIISALLAITILVFTMKYIINNTKYRYDDYKPELLSNKTVPMYADYVYNANNWDKVKAFRNTNNIYYHLWWPNTWKGTATIYVPNDELAEFVHTWLPNIKSKFILVTTIARRQETIFKETKNKQSYMDNSMYIIREYRNAITEYFFPARDGAIDPIKLLDNPRLVRWFASNYDHSVKHPKMTIFPLGVDYARKENANNFFPYCTDNCKYALFGIHGESVKDQEKELKNVIKNLKPNKDRIFKAYMDVHLNNTSSLRKENGTIIQNRSQIAKILAHNPWIEFQHGVMPRLDQWQKRGKYMFSISLIGLGFDCYRTWESLMLGNIVLLQSSPIDELFKDMPVVIIKDWNDINEKNLKKWANKYKIMLINGEYKKKLYSKYWLDIIEKTKTTNTHTN